MSNPYTPGFSAAQRGEWCRLTRAWLRRYAKVTTAELAAMTGTSPATIAMMSNRHASQVWFCELLAALVTGWRPTRCWPEAEPAAMNAKVQEYIWSPGHSLEEYGALLPVSLPRWAEAIYEGTADRVPPRLALMAEALLDGAAPSGLPFSEWAA